MSFNLGVSNHPISRLGGLSSIGIYLYEDIYYRQWITEIALAFYEGRQDEFIWLDLVRQFRNPEKQQILPINLTKEIVDETSILYRQDPIYKVVDKKGKILPKDTELWKEIMRESRYLTFMDKLDRWTKLLGTVLVKASFVDRDSGELVKETEEGKVQFDMLHGGSYDLKNGASPYYITELLIGFGNKFQGFNQSKPMSPLGQSVGANVPSPSNLGAADIKAKQRVDSPGQLGNINAIYWSPRAHVVSDDNHQEYETKNPYGMIPAVPFFNSDPAHYYFLPINEPLIYANHAINMRITDLNHIAKFQSFGVPVIKGVERPTSLRQGRPSDDFNQLKGGTAQSKFGGLQATSGFGAGGQFRTFDAGMGIVNDGNADANKLGFSIGPDTAVAVGEKGDFKFAHPEADIMGLVKAIHAITDMVRINHGLRPKYESQLPSSGFALLMEKIGVIEENIRRGKLFKEREQQLFHVVKTLWNVHNDGKKNLRTFSKDCRLEIDYVEPEFPVDPKTKVEQLILEKQILESGDRHSLQQLYKHKDSTELTKMIKDYRKDRLETAIFEAELKVTQAKILISAGIVDSETSSKTDIGKQSSSISKSSKFTIEGMEDGDEVTVSKPSIDNKVKHSQDASKQLKTNGDKKN